MKYIIGISFIFLIFTVLRMATRKFKVTSAIFIIFPLAISPLDCELTDGSVGIVFILYTRTWQKAWKIMDA